MLRARTRTGAHAVTGEMRPPPERAAGLAAAGLGGGAAGAARAAGLSHVVSPVLTFHQYGAWFASSKTSCHSLAAAGGAAAAGAAALGAAAAPPPPPNMPNSPPPCLAAGLAAAAGCSAGPRPARRSSSSYSAWLISSVSAIFRAAGRRRGPARAAPHARAEVRAAGVNEDDGANAIAASAEAASAIGTRTWPGAGERKGADAADKEGGMGGHGGGQQRGSRGSGRGGGGRGRNRGRQAAAGQTAGRVDGAGRGCVS